MSVTHTHPVRWGEGSPISGTQFRIVVAPEATGGHVVGIAVDMPPGVHVDEHVHPDEDQICIVLSGTVGCRVGGLESVIEAGSLQTLPRSIPHELWNAGDGVARLLEFYTPPGMEEHFRRAGAQALGHGAAQPSHQDFASNA